MINEAHGETMIMPEVTKLTVYDYIEMTNLYNLCVHVYIEVDKSHYLTVITTRNYLRNNLSP